MRIVSISFVLLLLAGPAHGQGLLNFQKSERSQRYDVYMADVSRALAETIDAWNEAWSQDDAEALSRIYREDATLYLQDEVLHGRDEIRSHFEKLLPHVDRAALFPVALDASGDLAFRVMTVLFDEGDEVGESRRLGRRDVFIFRKDWSDEWAIEAHFEGPAAEVEAGL